MLTELKYVSKRISNKSDENKIQKPGFTINARFVISAAKERFALELWSELKRFKSQKNDLVVQRVSYVETSEMDTDQFCRDHWDIPAAHHAYFSWP